MTADPLVVCEGVSRTYSSGGAPVVALHPTTCVIAAQARIALVGPSGSGKSTLLHLIAGLDEPTTGSVAWPGIGPRARLRPGPVAVVFQGTSLLPALTVTENVALPLVLGGAADADARRLAAISLDLMEIDDLGDKLPEEISGGQAQRVAIARVLAGEPRLILADEPTGQLDRATGSAVVEVLLAAADHAGAGLVVSTHDHSVADRLADRWQLRDGELAVGEAAGC